MHQSFCVAVPKNHPLAGRKQVRLAQLRQDAFLQLREGLQFRTIVQEILRRAQIEPDIVFESSSMENILAMVSAGAGISLVPDDGDVGSLLLKIRGKLESIGQG